jgi:hypothetical protein
MNAFTINKNEPSLFSKDPKFNGINSKKSDVAAKARELNPEKMDSLKGLFKTEQKHVCAYGTKIQPNLDKLK